MVSGSSYRPSGYYIPSSRGGSWTGGEKIAAIGLLIVVIILVIYFWSSSSPTPSPTPSQSPTTSPPPTWKPYCTFNASGTNKDNFNVASDSGIELFPIDLAVSEYNQPSAFDYDYSGNILTCKVNASTNSPEYAPSGPTTLGYTFPTITHSETLVPDDGTITKTDSICTWNPKSNICDTPICSLRESYNNVLLSDLDKEQGIKQYLSQEELNTFIDGLSCPGGYKYGQCSSKTSGDASNCSDLAKQNNKINCLGNCSGASTIYTKEDCEKDKKNKWVYEPEKSQCNYESLDKPPINIGNIQPIPSGEYQGEYKMCDNPGDYVNLDSMIDTCSNTCYPNPNNDYTPFNTNEMPLSWTNKCGFTDITNEKFTSNTYHITPCENSAVLKGNVYYNICSSDQNCSDVKSDIENHIRSVSSVSPPCQGGGDIFDVYNNCSAAFCDNIFSHSATTGSTYGQCPNNKTYIPSPGTESAISLPPATDCDPDLNIPFSIKDYYSKTAVDNCCVNKTCDDEYPNCKTGFSKRSPSPSPGSSAGDLTLQDCCVLETCSEYVTEKNPCVEGTTPTGSNNTYVLPTCCNGYIQITITLKNIASLMQLSQPELNSPLPNVFPSYILKKLLTKKMNLSLDSINSDKINSDKTQKTADNLYFINNQTTFMKLPTNKQTMDSALTQTQDSFRKNIPKLGNQNEYNFYILISQKYDSKSYATSFNISEAYTTVKNITDKISKPPDPNISKINASLTDCRDSDSEGGFKGICDIIESPPANQVLNGVNSYCCFKSTCGNMLSQDQRDKLSNPASSVSVPGWKSCGSGTYFDKDAPWTPSPSPISYINASNQCCVSGNITAVNPPGTTVGQPISNTFGSYVDIKKGGTEILLTASIDFKWVNNKFEIASKDKYMNASLADNYTCAFNNASTPEYGVSRHSNGTYYYKLTGCEDGDNKFCKIPNSYTQGTTESDIYDASIYDLTGLMQNNKGSYISMYATAQGGSESKHEGDIMANYGGIACTSDPYGTVDLKSCDEPYDYIKFSGCNTYFSEDGGHEFFTRSSDPNDCYGLKTSVSCNDEEYLHMCNWNTSKKTAVCEPRPFPIYGGGVGKSCGDNLNAETTFSDAFWLKEGFQNQTYKDTNIFKKGDSTRIIQTPYPSPGSSGPPASPREVSRRTNYCGYKPKSQDNTDQFHSRVVDSTWMCKDKTCKEDNNLNIQLPKDLPKLTSFTSYINGDPLIYNWSVTEKTVSNAKKDFYDGDYKRVNGSFTVDDYRPLQGLPLTTFNLTDKYACVNKKSPSSRCARPTASPGVEPECSSNCSLTTIPGITDINSRDNVNDRITRFTDIQNIGGVDYNASQMEYVHNNIKYHNNYATMCGDNKYLRFFGIDGDDYQKCTPCRYQRDPYSPTSYLPPNTYNELYTTELNQLKQDEQSNQHVYPKSSEPSKPPVFLSSVISPSPNPSPGGNQNIIINKTSPEKDEHKMSNCSVNTSSTKRTEIPIGEYSTHFVPWWSESSATDLKVTENNAAPPAKNYFQLLLNQLHQLSLSPGSPPINIPTCDLHKDRCEDKTQHECSVNSSHSWTSPSSQNFNMCSWSDGKCTTNPDWRNDQNMCGHPCLSRMDAKPRECKFSDDCEIRDRYNIGAFSGVANPKVTMYCDSDGRNPILYGTAEESEYKSNAMHNDLDGFCNPGYYLVDVGSSVNTGGSNKSVYKCLSCDELEFYKTDASSSGSITKNNMVNAFETYINACGTPAQRFQYNSNGEWKEGSDGKCSKGTGNCTAFLWPSNATTADPIKLLTKKEGNTSYTSAEVLYTQDPIVADNYIKSKIGSSYVDCNASLNTNPLNIKSSTCETYVSAMEKILGLTTREYDTDSKNFKGYNASQTIGQKYIDFSCDYDTVHTGPFMAKWDDKDTLIPVNPGGMVTGSKYKKLNELTRAGDICPQRGYLSGGRPSEKKNQMISMDDRYWPNTYKSIKQNGIKEEPYCKPLLDINQQCSSREDGKLACAPQIQQGSNYKYQNGICGLKDPKDGSGDPLPQNSKNDLYCLGGLNEGSDCNHDINYQCMEYEYSTSDCPACPTKTNWYGARCSLNYLGDGTCDGPNHRPI